MRRAKYYMVRPLRPLSTPRAPPLSICAIRKVHSVRRVLGWVNLPPSYARLDAGAMVRDYTGPTSLSTSRFGGAEGFWFINKKHFRVW